MKTTKDSAKSVCEAYLGKEIDSNEASGILPSQTALARRMLARGDDLQRFYEEIYPRLNQDGIAWKHVIGCALYIGSYWTPQKIARYRTEREQLVDINREIAKVAGTLAALLEKRDHLHNHSSFSSGTHYAIREVIDAASEHNGHYQSFLKGPLHQLAGRFDLKYWPALSEIVRVIATDAAQAQVSADSGVAEVATESSRRSKADMLRAFFQNVEEQRGTYDGAIPPDFELTNIALADLFNVLLDLPADQLITEAYVKTERHRFRAS